MAAQDSDITIVPKSTSSISVVAKGTGPGTTIVEKVYTLNISAEDGAYILAEDGTELIVEGYF